MIKAAIKHVSDMVTKRATAGSPSSSDDEEDERKDEIFDPVTPSKVSSSSSVGSGGIATKSPRSYIREFPYPYENLLSLNQIFFRINTKISVCIRVSHFPYAYENTESEANILKLSQERFNFDKDIVNPPPSPSSSVSSSR
jgi:hypothetical protein